MYSAREETIERTNMVVGFKKHVQKDSTASSTMSTSSNSTMTASSRMSSSDSSDDETGSVLRWNDPTTYRRHYRFHLRMRQA